MDTDDIILHIHTHIPPSLTASAITAHKSVLHHATLVNSIAAQETPIENRMVDLEALVGIEGNFYGIDMNAFKLDETIYDVIEDEEDGYRSSLDEVRIIAPTNKIFFRTPLARVQVEYPDEDNKRVYRLIDLVDRHCWLEFGTGNYDDYYPDFIFDYTPKEPGN